MVLEGFEHCMQEKGQSKTKDGNLSNNTIVEGLHETQQRKTYYQELLCPKGDTCVCVS